MLCLQVAFKSSQYYYRETKSIIITILISPRHDGWAVAMSGNAHCHLHSATEGDRTMRVHQGVYEDNGDENDGQDDGGERGGDSDSFDH